MTYGYLYSVHKSAPFAVAAILAAISSALFGMLSQDDLDAITADTYSSTARGTCDSDAVARSAAVAKGEVAGGTPRASRQ